MESAVQYWKLGTKLLVGGYAGDVGLGVCLLPVLMMWRIDFDHGREMNNLLNVVHIRVTTLKVHQIAPMGDFA